MAKIGLAFSGGGVRSAAFCSGVLRRLLQKNVKIDYLSCVSGGGYTGSAYMDWKYRHGKTDDKSWHQEFFNHMRERIGLICNWQKPCQAIGQSFAILGVILFGSLIVPVLTWISIAYPLAFVIDFLFGEVLRGGPSCPEVVQSKNITLEECEQGQPSLDVIYFHQAELFSTPLFLALLCFLLKIFVPKAKRLLELLSTFCLACFALLFFPWFIRDFLNYLPTWLKFAIFVPLFLAWISSPLTRSSATLMTGIYVSSFAIYWRVYKESVFGWGYTERSFELLLGMATLLQWILPLLGIIQQRLMHVYLR